MTARNPPPPAGPRRIAIVETDELIRELMVRWLQEARYLPVPIDPSKLNGFVDPLSKSPFVLVIADVAQPRAAAGLLRRLRATFSAPILLISARFRRGLPRAASVTTELGAAAALPKPFSRDELLAAVRSAALPHPAIPPTR